MNTCCCHVKTTSGIRNTLEYDYWIPEDRFGFRFKTGLNLDWQ
jgi:hypothetical protein